MNKLTIIGNLTKDPELRTTTTGVQVCTFTVAVNKRQSSEQRQNGQQPEADYFRVSAWREKGVSCSKFLEKGKKVCVIGPVSVRTYDGNDGKTRASLEIMADDVEFLSPRVSDPPMPQEPEQPRMDPQTGFQQVEMDTEDLPF